MLFRSTLLPLLAVGIPTDKRQYYRTHNQTFHHAPHLAFIAFSAAQIPSTLSLSPIPILPSVTLATNRTSPVDSQPNV